MEYRRKIILKNIQDYQNQLGKEEVYTILKAYGFHSLLKQELNLS